MAWRQRGDGGSRWVEGVVVAAAAAMEAEVKAEVGATKMAKEGESGGDGRVREQWQGTCK
jgi:hypothetical protein